MALAGCAVLAVGVVVAVGATAAPSQPSRPAARTSDRAPRTIVVDGEVIDLMDTSDTGVY